VTKKAETPWIASSVHGESESGVVPCLQSMRIVIAQRLTRKKREENDKGGTQEGNDSSNK
jgi:hypothetical protein